MLPQPGQIARVRSRRWLVEDVEPPAAGDDRTLVRLSCLDDDHQGAALEVLWETELDAETLGQSSWAEMARRGFDSADRFSAYLHTLRWHCVTATDPRLFQAPWRAGIEVKAYQLEPLRKALLLPRVNLFIADDVGLGKTIEAGLILRELILRQKVRRVVVATPASILLQWQDELAARFGLGFALYDRDFVVSTRRDRGWAVNPWGTHSRFLVSHALLRDETHQAQLRDWLGDFCPGSLLILDEAHHAAPASSARYAIDSHFTRAIRDLAPRFEHRLFLSATPHNGHSNSFAALLEILDSQRFCRGVPVTPKQLDAVMVRRLKSDLRRHGEAFPKRRIVQIDLDGLRDDAPELRLARLLDQYADARRASLGEVTRRQESAAQLVISGLQQRLFSSIEAFARTLAVHRRSLGKAAAKAAQEANAGLNGNARGGHGSSAASLVDAGEETTRSLFALRSDDGDHDDATDAERDAQESVALEAATEVTATASASERSREILDEMNRIADAARAIPDARVRWLVDWIRAHPNDRLIIFTEYADTKRWLDQQLRGQLRLDAGDERIATFDRSTVDERREELKRAFNTDPARHPLRVLIATDAAREGLNLQNHCADLVHFDVPWNPSRMEQRNGRIDRKLQRAAEVRCHYFVFVQRPADRVLRALVRKTETIAEQLGSLTPVLDARLQRIVRGGIPAAKTDALVRVIDEAGEYAEQEVTVEAELEATRERDAALAAQLDRLRRQMEHAQKTIALDETHFRNALSTSLRLAGAKPLVPDDSQSGRWRVPDLRADRSWQAALDSLRPPRPRDQKIGEWRASAPLRPVVFRDTGTIDDDVVHLHLEQTVVRRLLSRFLAQGFVYHDLSRACVGQTRDSRPRVILLGRLSLYGEGAARLHDEIVTVAAHWQDPALRKPALAPLAEGGTAEQSALALLEATLEQPRDDAVPASARHNLLASLPRDVEELLPHLEKRSQQAASAAECQLGERGQREAHDMHEIIAAQRKRIAAVVVAKNDPQLVLAFDEQERRQLDADRRHWSRRLADLDAELSREPERIRATYAVKTTRIEPVGVVYLWPVTG